MKKYNKTLLPLLLLSTLFTAGCSKEDQAIISNQDQEWLKVSDNPDDPTDHSIYQLFQETGIPVFYNDTIGQASRIDMWGKPYIHYERLRLEYSLGGVYGTDKSTTSITQYSLPDKQHVPAAIQFLREEIFNRLSSKVHVPSILLLETLNTKSFGNYAFKGLNTIAIGQISTIPVMDATTIAKYKGAIFRAILTTAFLDARFADQRTRFLGVSRKFYPAKDIYTNGGIGSASFPSLIKGFPAGYKITFQDIGFIGSDPNNAALTPRSDWMDVCMFIEAMMGNTQTSFNAQFGAFPAVIQKRNIMLEIFNQLEIEMQ